MLKIYIFFILFYCLLLHHLIVRISLPFLWFSTSHYCTDPGLQLGDPAPLNGLSLRTCWYIYFFLLDLCVYREKVVRGESRKEYLWKRPCYSWCYSCKKSEASSIITEFERLLKIVGSSYSHSLPERSLHFHSLHQPILLFFSSRSIPVEGKLRLSNLQLPNLFYSIKNPTFVTTGTGLE